MSVFSFCGRVLKLKVQSNPERRTCEIVQGTGEPMILSGTSESPKYYWLWPQTKPNQIKPKLNKTKKTRSLRE